MEWNFNKKVQNIENIEVLKTFKIDNKNINIRIKDAFVGTIRGKKEILDEQIINDMIKQVIDIFSRNKTRYNPLPCEIVIYRNSVSDHDKDKKMDADYNMLEICEPKLDLDQVALNENVKNQIKSAISVFKHKKTMIEKWGMDEFLFGDRATILNFYGKSGTGKTLVAQAVAKYLNKNVYKINYSQLESKFVGDTPKNIRKAFETARKNDAVLIFDEADSFLGKRLTSITQSADYGVNITRSVLLMELEKFDGIVIFTTNLLQNYDSAFKRRILLNILFEMPNEECREQIWNLHLSPQMPLGDVNANVLAKRYDNISGADIKDIVYYAALYALENGKDKLDYSVFDVAYQIIANRYENKTNDFKIISSKKIYQEEYEKEINKKGV